MAKENKTALIQLKVTEDQRNRLRALADAQGLTMTQYIRWALLYKDKQGEGRNEKHNNQD